MAVKPGTRGQNGWGYVVRIGDAVYFDYGVTASLSDWLPDFRRVPSKANVADAVSRGDLSAAHRHGWTRVQTPVASILKTLARAAEDLEFAVNGAADELVSLAA